MSGLISPQAVTNQFFLDRQGNVSVYHEKTGLIITGANSKRQPELATFNEKVGGQTLHMPTSSELRMDDDRDRLGLSHHTFFSELEFPEPTKREMRFSVSIVERGRIDDARLNLQLCLKAGQNLRVGKTKIMLGSNRIEIGPKELKGSIRHNGWTLHTNSPASLVWPVFPFNPYANGPETKLEHAVGALSIPLNPRQGSVLHARTDRIEIAIEC